LECDRPTDATEKPNELLEREAIEAPPSQIRDAGLIGAYQPGRIRLTPALEAFNQLLREVPL